MIAIDAEMEEPNKMKRIPTKFFISLAAFEGELISRSQAKCVVARFEHFEEVELDFAGVDYIGRSFADELVRVWPLAHSDTRIKIVNASEAVTKMLKHSIGRGDLPQPANTIEIDVPDKSETNSPCW